jgi:hypothetical protein
LADELHINIFDEICAKTVTPNMDPGQLLYNDDDLALLVNYYNICKRLKIKTNKKFEENSKLSPFKSMSFDILFTS